MDKKTILIFLFAAVLMALVLSPFASPWPDGLERVAENKGFIDKGEVRPTLRSPIPDYLIPGVKNEKLATAIAGVLGTLLMFGAGCGLAGLLNPGKKGKNTDAPPLS